MEFVIHKTDMQNAPKAEVFSRKFIVKSRIVLDIENEKLVYTIANVEPYERNIHAEDVNYGFSDNGPTIFFAEADRSTKLAGRIKMLEWWNKFAYVDDIVVNPEFRGTGIGRARGQSHLAALARGCQSPVPAHWVSTAQYQCLPLYPAARVSVCPLPLIYDY